METKEKKVKKICTVEGCQNQVAPNNRFLCKIHYKYFSDEDNYRNNLTGYGSSRTYRSPAL